MEVGAFHQHTGQEEHGITLPAAGRTKVGATFTITIGSHVHLDVLKQLVCCKELRIATHNLDVLIRTVRKVHKVLHNCKQSFFTEQSLYHSHKGTDAIQFLILRIDLSPGIEEIIWTEEGTVFIVRTVADNDKCVIFENLRNVSAVTHGQLLVRIHDCGILFDCTLELKVTTGIPLTNTMPSGIRN